MIEVKKVIEVPVEKIIIRETCGEDQHANHTKNGGDHTKNWGRPGCMHCEQLYVEGAHLRLHLPTISRLKEHPWATDEIH